MLNDAYLYGNVNKSDFFKEEQAIVLIQYAKSKTIYWN